MQIFPMLYNRTMSDKVEEATSSGWKRPDEVMRLHRLKVKQRALQARINRSNETANNASFAPFSQPAMQGKRKNPFVKENCTLSNTKLRSDAGFSTSDSESSTDQALFVLLAGRQPQQKNNRLLQEVFKDVSSVTTPFTYINNHTEALPQGQPIEKVEDVRGSTTPPIDWSLKVRLRLLSRDPLPGHPKTSQEASGLTSFVRCTSDGGGGSMDTSLGARLQQASLYWMHPSLPGEKLFPRKARGSIAVAGLPQDALLNEWSDSFRSIFQLLRAKQCPYFYLCANTFTALFRAAGVGGEVEPHALISPTTQGFRQTLKQEDIMFTMPLRKSDRKSSESAQNVSPLAIPKEKENGDSNNHHREDKNNIENSDDDDDDDDVSQEQWLESLGVEASEIKKINHSTARIEHISECREDFSEMSLVVVQGNELQALYNFLLNSKSTVGGIGIVPPTLLAPTGFLGASLKALQIRFSRVRMDGSDFNSVELRGPILPNTLRSLCDSLIPTRESFSITTATLPGTQALSKAAKTMITEVSDEKIVFGRENLSGCGLSLELVNDICRANKENVVHVDGVRYQAEKGYTWS